MTEIPDERTVPARRAAPEPTTAPPAPTDALDRDVADTAPAVGSGFDSVTGSTVIAHRESRRRATPASDSAAAETTAVSREPAHVAPVASQAPGATGRIARSPETGVAYTPRASTPTTIPRVASAPRSPHALTDTALVDTALIDASRQRRARRRALVVIMAAATVAVGALVLTIVVLAWPAAT